MFDNDKESYDFGHEYQDKYDEQAKGMGEGGENNAKKFIEGLSNLVFDILLINAMINDIKKHGEKSMWTQIEKINIARDRFQVRDIYYKAIDIMKKEEEKT